MTTSRKYYQSELGKIDTSSIYPPSIKITGEGCATKHLNLNDESAAVLIEWLRANYNVK